MKRSVRTAVHIAHGLVATGRARRLVDLGDMLWLERKAGGHYFVSRDGRELRAGEDFASAEPLQEKFVQAMAAAGRG
ncbi:MAG TPA: hypothetical protein VMU06_12975 [Stellaceae bacterium]|nr:hypothetical protein [Stellaceae bacterium]